jgi:hypothetical protein
MDTPNRELDSDDGILGIVHLDMLHSRLDGSPTNTKFLFSFPVNQYSLAGVVHAILLPRECPPIFAE